MEIFFDIFKSMLIPMSINYFFAITSLMMTLCVIWFIDVVFLKSIDTIEEIKKGNLSVAVVISTIIYSISHLIAYMAG